MAYYWPGTALRNHTQAVHLVLDRLSIALAILIELSGKASLADSRFAAIEPVAWRLPTSVGDGEVSEVEPFRAAVRVDNLDAVINLPGRGDLPAAVLNILEELRQRHVAGQLWGG